MPSLIERQAFSDFEQSHSNQKIYAMKTTLIFFIVVISLGLRLAFIFHSDLLVEEAYYWNYANHLDMGYLDHPPMVALLIKITTLLFGINEFGVRISTLLCWFVTTWFICKLTNLISKGSGIYAIMLLSIFPFFFLQSMIITPDQPLILCWSAALYCLFRALVKQESRYWYAAGIWIGLGLLSKYTVVLLGFATLIYVIFIPEYRVCLKRKEPYFCALIAIFFFTPVIYWNATHAWASFAFQSTRRFNATDDFSFYQYLGLLVLFLTPLGLFSLWTLYRPPNLVQILNVEYYKKRFLQLYTMVPLVIFGLFSLRHQIKFNWIGPGLLAIIPWIAIDIADNCQKRTQTLLNGWIITAILLLSGYSSLIFIGATGTPAWAYQAFLTKYIDWNNLTLQINQIAHDLEQETHHSPTIIPLDSYNIGSELSFYQEKQWKNGNIEKIYPIIGSHVFGRQSLMYQYWSNNVQLFGKMLLLVSKEPSAFFYNDINKLAIKKSSIHEIWSKSPKKGNLVTPYYYQIVEMKPKTHP